MITKGEANAATKQHIVEVYDSVITDAFEVALGLCIRTAVNNGKYRCSIDSLPSHTECVVKFLKDQGYKVSVRPGGKDKITIDWR